MVAPSWDKQDKPPDPNKKRGFSGLSDEDSFAASCCLWSIFDTITCCWWQIIPVIGVLIYLLVS